MSSDQQNKVSPIRLSTSRTFILTTLATLACSNPSTGKPANIVGANDQGRNETAQSLPLELKPAHCAELPNKPLSQKDYLENRPSDFYAMCYSSNDDLCEEAHNQLNEFKPFKPANQVERFVRQTLGDGLWLEQQAVTYRADTVYRANIDIFNNDRAYTVYTAYSRLGGVKSPLVLVDTSESSDGSMELPSKKRVKLLSADDNSPSGAIRLPASLKTHVADGYWWVGAAPVVVNDVNLVAFFTPATDFPDAKVSLVLMTDRKNGELVCQYRGNYKITKQ